MNTITDNYMKEMMDAAKNYTVVIINKGPSYSQPEAGSVIWEHGRRNFALRKDGRLAIVLPVNDGGNVSGIGIFTTGAEDTKTIMAEDPGVKQGVFVYEIHSAKSFQGDKLT